MKVPKIEIQIIGIRPGEKIHETLLTAEEKHFSNETEKYFQVSNIVQEMPGIFSSRTAQGSDYTSEQTHILAVEELADILVQIPMIKKMIN